MMKLLVSICLIFNTINGVIPREPECNNKVSLTTTNSNDNGASIQLLEDTTITVNNEWEIIPKSRNGALDMLINLDNKWGFDPFRVSTIRITMYGTTPISMNDRDLIISFSVDSSKYFSSFYRLDNGFDGFGGGGLNEISACDISPNPTQTLLTGDVYALSQVNNGKPVISKVNAAGGDFWEPAISRNNQWPLIFTLTNDPINNYLFIKYQGIEQQQCGFEAFSTNKGLQIYLAADHPWEIHTFCQFDIEYCIGDTIIQQQQQQQDNKCKCNEECDECSNKYVYINDGISRNYADAKALCDNKYSGLATIVNENEFECAISLIEQEYAAWIGLQSLDNNIASFTYLDGTDCPIVHNGKYGQCVPSSFWKYKGRPRCPFNHTNEYGSFCVNINQKYIDNDVDCDKTLSAVLCNAEQRS